MEPVAWKYMLAFIHTKFLERSKNAVALGSVCLLMLSF